RPVSRRDHVAASDCEEIRPGLIGQPANTLSSLGFVAAAVPVARFGTRPGHRAWRAVAAALALEGVGSVAYHGPGGRVSKAVHDIGLVALVAAMAGVEVQYRGRWRPGPLDAGLAVAAVALHTLSRTGGPLCSCRSRLQGHAVFHLLAAGAVVAAARSATTREAS